MTSIKCRRTGSGSLSRISPSSSLAGFNGVSSFPFNLLVPSFQCSVSRCCRTRSSANSFVAMIEDFRLVSVSPHLQLFPPSPAAALCPSLDAHDSRSTEHHYAPMLRDCSSWPTRPLRNRPGPDNRRIGTGPNQGREPPLVWSVEFMKKVHVASNDTAPPEFRLMSAPCRTGAKENTPPNPTAQSPLPSNAGSFAMLLAMRRASSSVSDLAT